MRKTEKPRRENPNARPLTLRRHTLRRLDPAELQRAVGGAACPCAWNGEWTSKVDA